MTDKMENLYMSEQIKEEKPDWREHYILFQLNVETKDEEKVYFLTRQNSHASHTREDDEYHFQEHTCPTNFIDVNTIATLNSKGEMDADPHGLFLYIGKIEVEEGDKIIASEHSTVQSWEEERLIRHLIGLKEEIDKKAQEAEDAQMQEWLENPVLVANKVETAVPSLPDSEILLKRGWSWPITFTPYSFKVEKTK